MPLVNALLFLILKSSKSLEIHKIADSATYMAYFKISLTNIKCILKICHCTIVLIFRSLCLKVSTVIMLQKEEGGTYTSRI
jgi:hypothetical protein